MKTIIFLASLFFGSASSAVACPVDGVIAGSSYTVSGRQLYSPLTYSVVAGGGDYLWDCSDIQPGTDTGAGYFTTSPDFSFSVSEISRFQLEMSVISDCDSALLINTGSTRWHYDDDANGDLNPSIMLSDLTDGRVDVWVGTYDGEYCNARLKLETFDR